MWMFKVAYKFTCVLVFTKYMCICYLFSAEFQNRWGLWQMKILRKARLEHEKGIYDNNFFRSYLLNIALKSYSSWLCIVVCMLVCWMFSNQYDVICFMFCYGQMIMVVCQVYMCVWDNFLPFSLLYWTDIWKKKHTKKRGSYLFVLWLLLIE